MRNHAHWARECLRQGRRCHCHARLIRGAPYLVITQAVADYLAMDSHATTTKIKIPIVDFAQWTSKGPTRVRCAQEIVFACQKVGFVYLVNHSLADSFLEEAFHWSQLFFGLPQHEKLKAPHPEGWAIHRGYSWPGLEKVSQVASADNDKERIQQLREIPDVKVR